MQCERPEQVRSLGQEAPLEKGMAMHSSIPLRTITDRGVWQGYSPWGRGESDTNEQLTLSLSYK